jgi:hypothetical protein
VALCVLKIVAITALCYKAFRPFAKIVLNNKFVLAARKTNPSTPTSQQQRLSGINSKSRKSGKAATSAHAAAAPVNDHHDGAAVVVVESPLHNDGATAAVVVPPMNNAGAVVLPPIKHAPALVIPAVPVLPEIRQARLSVHTSHLQGPSRASVTGAASTATATADTIDEGAEMNMAVESASGSGAAAAAVSQDTHHTPDSDMSHTVEHGEQL